MNKEVKSPLLPTTGKKSTNSYIVFCCKTRTLFVWKKKNNKFNKSVIFDLSN